MGLKFLSKRLKEARKEAGYSQQDLAKLIEIDVSTIQAFEQGLKVPTDEQLLRLAQILHQPIWHFFGFDG